ncbi:MAG: ribonuclease P protein component [Desulfosalsimonas sp.]
MRFDPARRGFPKCDRLLKRREFVYLSRQGSSVGNRLFIVAFRRNNLGRPRLGVTVTRKTGSAVVRNRIKRLVREFFRQNRHLLGAGIDVNVIARKTAAHATSQQAYAALRQLFGKIGGHTD